MIHIQLIKVKDQNLKNLGVLENAHNIQVDRRVNELWMASFTLLKNDPKNDLCTHLNYVEITSPSGRYMGLYRIMPTETRKAIGTNRIIYRCQHVLATLLDDVMDGYHQFTNYTTTEVINMILNLQTVKRWKLKASEFTRFFHYGFENENGLLAPLLSIPKPFNERYEFKYDTTVYPWELSLVSVDDVVKSEIRWGKDMIDFEEVSDPTGIVNYLIPKGAGEGINQLDIRRVNGGRRYIQDAESIAKWGRHTYIWIDKRFTDEESLLSSGQALLDEWKNPKISFDCKAVDLSIKPEYQQSRRLLNSVTNIIVDDEVFQARIIGEKFSDLKKEWEVEYEIENRLGDITTTQADIERKQQVNEAYSQGATNIMTFGYQDNCDDVIPAVIPFYIDDDVVNINTCELTFRTNYFRAYSRATKGGGALVKSTGGGGGTVKSTGGGGGTTRSTTSGGGTTATSSSGGGVAKSTASGGGSSQTSSSGGGSNQSSSAGGDHSHIVAIRTGAGTIEASPAIYQSLGAAIELKTSGGSGRFETWGGSGNHTHSTSIPNHTHNVTIPTHSHSFDIPNHTHSVAIPNHSHDVTIPNHTHEIELPNHTHEIELPNHTHEVEHKIIELNSLPSKVLIKVDGNVVPHTSTSGNRINLVDYMSKDSGGRITRGRHEVEILPDDLARIEADLILRVFIQSHLGIVA